MNLRRARHFQCDTLKVRTLQVLIHDTRSVRNEWAARVAARLDLPRSAAIAARHHEDWRRHFRRSRPAACCTCE
jgi:hypothetical protein